MRLRNFFEWRKFRQFFLAYSTAISLFCCPLGFQTLITQSSPRLTNLLLASSSAHASNEEINTGDSSSSTVVFIRHGESTFNNRNIFTGWCDVDLTEKGIQEAYDAGILLASHGFNFDVAHTSVLKRATKSTHKVLDGMDKTYIPIQTSWRLNERHYGALQGKNKAITEQELGPIVKEWRRSYSTRPPTMEESHSHWLLLKNDVRYKDVSIPKTESLKDTQVRVVEYWNSNILPDISGKGKSVLVVAHANTLRALVKAIDGISDESIKELHIPTGEPFVYSFNDKLAPMGKPDSLGFRGVFLGTIQEDPCARQYVARRNACEVKFSENPEEVPEECLVPVPEGCQVDDDFYANFDDETTSKHKIPVEKMVGEPDPQVIPYLQSASEDTQNMRVLPSQNFPPKLSKKRTI
mmetsp:Transcript_19389/g.25018  ORF Transcript_19389/g.25018 Transcript_19389/m.25018 type:complete len:409 (+) Transcript_19389:120-1346(+)